ncbi:MAG: 6-phosphogluconolactonase, partial [Myxococcales bacterium]|nr:6-phosphogluconolactonase [Myxococcales bacterium]
MRVVRAGPELTEAASGVLIRALKERLRDKPRVTLALSGGRTPWAVFRLFAQTDLEWNRVDIYQV